MRNNKDVGYQYTSCTAVIGSMTWALKAQAALAATAIPCAVIKAEERHGIRGCVYGVSFACVQRENVRRALEAAKIPVREWNDGN